MYFPPFSYPFVDICVEKKKLFLTQFFSSSSKDQNKHLQMITQFTSPADPPSSCLMHFLIPTIPLIENLDSEEQSVATETDDAKDTEVTKH